MFNSQNPHVKRNVILVVIAFLLVVGTIGALSPASDSAGNKPAKAKPFVPDVRGLNLPDATKTLKRYHYAPSVKDDAAFGVIIPEHFTVCKQHDPKGHLVPIDVSKECKS